MFTGFLFIFELGDHGLESAKRQLQESVDLLWISTVP